MRWLARIKHMAVVTWRSQNGRWYVFRDRPDWFVVEIAHLTPRQPSDDFARLIVAAQQELRQRQATMARKILQELGEIFRV